MPFDFAPFQEPSRKGELPLREKLNILRELLPQSGDQQSFKTCLWSVARKDARLIAAGISRLTPPSPGDSFLPSDIDDIVWSGDSKTTKAVFLDRTIAAIEAADDIAPSPAPRRYVGWTVRELFGVFREPVNAGD